MLNEDAILAVKRGAYLMDDQYPGWASTINFDTFEMDNCHTCIVGQAIGEYGEAISKFSGHKPYSNDASLWAVEYGFDVPMSAYEDENEFAAYAELETLWTEQVRERLGDAPQA